MDLFKSFFIGGYECADMINNRGQRVDLLKDTAHDSRVDEDYRLLSELGIQTVREGIRWTVVETEPHRFDFSEVKRRMEAGKRWGIQQLWDVCHFGYPDGLMPSHPQFADRFVSVCEAFTRFYKENTDEPLIITPINEISFISWLGGDARGTVPFAIRSGFDVKYFLCRAAIKGIEAIKRIDPKATVMFVEPLIRVHPKVGEQPCDAVRACNEGQFETMDIVTGRRNPELGGHPGLVDVAGFNYYYNNQWEHGGPTYGWHPNHRRTCFSELLKDAADRYKIPVALSETGHFLKDRGRWMEQITADCIKAMKAGVDLRGICVYPVLDRPDWDTGAYIPCGIWGYDEKTKDRYVEREYYNVVMNCMAEMNDYLALKTGAVERRMFEDAVRDAV